MQPSFLISGGIPVPDPMKWEEVQELALQDTPYLVDKIVPHRSLGILVGQYGIGKSPLAVQLAQTMAIGDAKFISRYACRREPMRTLYIDLENGAAPLARIGMNVARAIGLERPPDGSRVFSPNWGPAKAESQAFDRYINDVILKDKPDFVIIDPLRIYSPTAEEKNTNAAIMVASLRQIVKATGTTILLIHHPRKPPVDPRISYSLKDDPHAWMTQASGSSALVQNVDFRIGCEPYKDGIVSRVFIRTEGWGPTLTLKRIVDPVDSEPLGYELVDDTGKLSTIDIGMYQYNLGKTFTTADVKSMLKKDNAGVDRWIKTLMDNGMVEKNWSWYVR